MTVAVRLEIHRVPSTVKLVKFSCVPCRESELDVIKKKSTTVVNRSSEWKRLFINRIVTITKAIKKNMLYGIA